MMMEASYNPGLVILSVAVAILSAYVALDLSFSVNQAKGYAKYIWLICGSLAMGFGIWSMHFIGMLAFEMPGMTMAYDVPLMAISLLIALGASGLALSLMGRTNVRRTSLVLSAVTMAAAILGMHYVGMASMRLAAHIEWNYWLVGLSALIALVASFVSFAVAVRLRNRPDRLWFLICASVVMGIAISAMHYTGMAAATFVHEGALSTPDTHLVVTTNLAVIAGASAMLVLVVALATTLGQRIILLRQRASDLVLGNSEKKFRLLVEAVKDYAIMMLNPQGFITTWNVGAERMTGYAEHEMVGKHISALYGYRKSWIDEAENEMRTARETGHFEGEALRVRRDGTSFWANIVLDPLYDERGVLTGYSKVVRDVTQFKVTEERTRTINEELESRVRERTIALQAREAQLRTITNAIPVLVAQFDDRERLLFANNSFCRYFEVNADQIRGLSFREILGPERYPANKTYIDQALEGRRVTYERHSLRHGKTVSLEVTLMPEFTPSEQVIGFIVVASDVTKHKEIEAQLKAAKEEAEVANNTKSAFLANMSHEIRTPLGAVIGFSELMLDSDLSVSERHNGIEIIKRNGRLLSTIINDILDLSKVEAGKIEYESHETELQELLSEIAALLELEAAAKGVQFSISLEGVVPTTIKTDPTRLRQILFNIVGNAIKFTDKGSVAVKVKLDPRNHENIAFYVKDTGTGISPEQAKRLFSPFTQADPTTTRRFGGSGLGLALSRKLATALGGNVELVESTLGQGSTFMISVQHGQSSEVPFESRRESPTSNVIKIVSHVPAAELANRRILVVDDSTDNLALVRKILTLVGAQVDTSTNGREAVAKALAGNYSLILMDLQMPEMDGFEATRLLREAGYKNPIIALTAHAMKEERRRCLENGFNDHLTKPIDRSILIQTLAEYPA